MAIDNGFNRNLVLPDTLFSYSPKIDVQKFLITRQSFLKDYTDNLKGTADIINEHCKTFDIPQKWILVRLQSEQGLISRKSKAPLSIMDRALGVGCADRGDIRKYYGFTNQIYFACKFSQRWFSEGKDKLGKFYCVNQGKFSPGINVYPESQFTYLIYKYTPHTGEQDLFIDYQGRKYSRPFGAYLTFKIWKNYWPEDIPVYI